MTYRDWHVPHLERAYPDPDCGCPVEVWLLHGIELTIHFEDDGTMEVYADAGDWDANVALAANAMDAAREETFAWVRALQKEEELAARYEAQLLADYAKPSDDSRTRAPA